MPCRICQTGWDVKEAVDRERQGFKVLVGRHTDCEEREKGV